MTGNSSYYPATPLSILKDKFGFHAFRDGQEESIDAVLNGNDTLAVMPTGSGKSICYQIPALLLPGVTLVISPLIALMKDQVDSLSQLRIPATFLNSTLSLQEAERRIDDVRRGQYKLLYIAPERFHVASFMKLINLIEVSLLAVDEAHCVSQWGHDFRPSYLKIDSIRKRVGSPVLIALTATATKRVQQDITEQLKLSNPKIFIKGFDRPNLKFFAIELNKDDQKKRELLRIIEAVKGSGIVYVATQNAVTEISSLLNDQQIVALGYHGGMDKNERNIAQNKWLNGDVPVIVATNAFGMGIDKPDVRFVLHYNIPGSVEAYYQEAGRAGRDGKFSYCVLLYSYRDRMIQEYLIENNFPSEDTLQDIYEFVFSLNRRQILLTYREIAKPTGCNDMQVGAAIKLFERYGILERMKKTEIRFSVEILKDSAQKKKALSRAPLQQKLFSWLEKQNLSNLSFDQSLKELEFSVEQFNHSARQLELKKIITYEPPFRGRGIELTSQYQSWNKIPIDFKAYHQRKQQQLDRFQEIEDYILERKCRRKYLLEYFGEPYKKTNCNACDVCLKWESPENKKQSHAKNDEIQMLLECVFKLDGVFGVTSIASILKGNDDQRFANWEIEENDFYGALMHKSEKAIIAMTYGVIRKGLLNRTSGKYPKLEITEKGIKQMSRTK